MSLRSSFTSFLTQAASTLVAGRPARSLHTIRGVGAGGAAAVIAAALTGGAGILIFKKRPDDDVMKPRQEDIKEEEVDINKDVGKHQMDVVEAKFHEWMEEVGREYPNEEEKAYRFELFKENLKEIETLYEGRVKDILPNCFGDRTDDEIRTMLANCHKPRSKEYEESLMQMKKKIDERMILIEKEKAKRNVVNCSKQ